MKFLYTIICELLFFTSIFGQGAYLEIGQSGFGIGGGFSTNEDVTGIGANVGYSFKDILDFGIGVESYNFDEQLLGEDLVATVISPSIIFYPFKQDDKLPISLAIGATYDWQTYSNDVLDDYNIDMTGNFISMGGSLFGYFKPSFSFRIQPSIGFSYVTGKMKVEDSNGNTESEQDDTTIFTLGLGLAFNTTQSNIFVISPRVGINEGTTTFGLGLIFIFTTN